MSLTRTVLPSLRCAHCRTFIVNRFATLPIPNTCVARHTQRNTLQSRNISTSASFQLPRIRTNRRKQETEEFEPLVEGINEAIEDQISHDSLGGTSTLETAALPTLQPKFVEPWNAIPQPSDSVEDLEPRIKYTPGNSIPGFKTIYRAAPTSNTAETPSLTTSSSSPSAEESTAPTLAPVPWYLQQSAPTQSSDNPLAARQQIPELPPHPPPVLHTLLSHISTDLGLDDLALLDLRHLDPPSALGNNLIMVIGTARSEKHLHVSADRFCRWIRREFHMKPYAAGLLGRNELKIKLRRKAKRAKVMATAGVTEVEAADDGIRSGWICVTVGRIEEAVDAPQKERPAFIGWGEEEKGCMIVVQMFVEDKREEIDLEELWGSVSEEHWRRQQRIAHKQDQDGNSEMSPDNVEDEHEAESSETSHIKGAEQRRSDEATV